MPNDRTNELRTAAAAANIHKRRFRLPSIRPPFPTRARVASGAATVTLVSGDNGTAVLRRPSKEGRERERVGPLRRHGEIEEWVDRKAVMDQFPGPGVGRKES